MDCGAALDQATAAPTNELPVVVPTAVTPVVTHVTAPTETVPIKIVEQTSVLPLGVQPAPHQIGGVVWHPMAVDPWPTPQSQPTVVGAPLRPGPLAVLVLLATAAGIAGCIAQVGSYQFADGTSARFTMNDLRSNSLGVALAVAAVAVVGLALTFGRQRVGVGLTGGAATALASVVTMDIAVVVSTLHEARRSGLATGSVTITWEPGFYALVAAGVLGLVGAVVAFQAWREGGPGTHPAVAVVGAAAVVTMLVGTLLPTGGQRWSDNLHVVGFSELPSALRLLALAFVGLIGLVGFLSTRRWTLGLAIGATTALAAQWVGTFSPPDPNNRGGPGIAVRPLHDAALTVNAVGLVAVVVIGAVAFAVAEARA